MPRVNKVNKAAKDYPEYGILKGEPYFWWKFRYGGKRVSKTYPKASQLTQSEYLGRIYDLQERDIEGETLEDLENLRDEIVQELEEIRDEQQEKLDNMPEGLQQGSTGELLQERYDTVDGVISELESIDFSEDEDADEDVVLEDKADEIRSAIENLC